MHSRWLKIFSAVALLAAFELSGLAQDAVGDGQPCPPGGDSGAYAQCLMRARGCSVDEYLRRQAAAHEASVKEYTLEVPAALAACPRYPYILSRYRQAVRGSVRVTVLASDALGPTDCGVTAASHGRAIVGLPEKLYSKILGGCALVRPAQTASDLPDSRRELHDDTPDLHYDPVRPQTTDQINQINAQ